MIDRKGSMRDEDFIPNREAIHKLAQSYKEMLSFTIFPN